MALAHRRGFRTLITRKSAPSYTTLDGDDGAAKKISQAKSKKGKSKKGSPKSVVSLRTVPSTDDEASQLSDVGFTNDTKVIVCDGQTEKVTKEGSSFPGNFLESTRLMAVEMVQRTSTMTSIVARSLASNSVVNERGGADETKEPNDTATGETDDGKTDDAPPQTEEKQQEAQTAPQQDWNGIALEQEFGRRLEQAFGCGSEFIETSKERVDSAFEKTHRAANDLIESSACIGREVMTSTEQSTQAVIFDKLPLTPMLEQTSERLEKTYEAGFAELQEFIAEHWDLLQTRLVSWRGGGTIDNVRPTEDETVLNVSIEVQMKALE
eukprot:CAMPEP_0197180026 /NCGR_PEP_ID=MMETSP1423-20130617/4792_1 /TAXON_ID=476441 /ORGANISM="Pseudo-nitzschia heimii, Strain UNC1101" /LENGTH=323 /DNA_ID=CAMNT_0042630045 /DNA_START=230 /DNA_END=1201 /DNA_ORIENTATION=-